MNARFSFQEMFRFLISRRRSVLLCIIFFMIIGGCYGILSWEDPLQPPGDNNVFEVELQETIEIEVDESLLMEGRDIAFDNDLQRKKRLITYLLKNPIIIEGVIEDPSFNKEWFSVGIEKEENEEEDTLKATNIMETTSIKKIVDNSISISMDDLMTCVFINVKAKNIDSCRELIDLYWKYAKYIVDDYFGMGMVNFVKISSKVITGDYQVDMQNIDDSSILGGNALKSRMIRGMRQAVLLGIGGAAFTIVAYLVYYLLMDFASSTNVYERYRLPLFATAEKAKIQQEGERLSFNLSEYFEKNAGKNILALPVGRIKNSEALVNMLVESADGVRLASKETPVYPTNEHVLCYMDPANKSPEFYRLIKSCDGILLIIWDAHTTHEKFLELSKGLIGFDKQVIGIIEIV